MDEEATSYPAPQRRPIVRKLAKEPSWILLGFLLGAAFVWLLPDSDDSRRSTATTATAEASAAGDEAAGDASSASGAVAENKKQGGPAAGERRALPVRRLSTIEAVFEAWGQYAVWEHDLTQIALWSAEHGGYAECYEVVRSGDALYFRSIPKLSRPVINYGTQITSPLLYTETETTRAARAGGRPVPLETPPGNAQSQQGTPPPPRVKKAQAFQGEVPRRVEVSLPDALVPPPPPRLQAPDTLTPEIVVPTPEESTTSPVRKEVVPPQQRTDPAPQQQTTVPTPPKTTSMVPEPSRSKTSPAPRMSNSGYLRLSSC